MTRNGSHIVAADSKRKKICIVEVGKSKMGTQKHEIDFPDANSKSKVVNLTFASDEQYLVVQTEARVILFDWNMSESSLVERESRESKDFQSSGNNQNRAFGNLSSLCISPSNSTEDEKNQRSLDEKNQRSFFATGGDGGREGGA